MEINEQIRKYRNNQLTPTELKELREKVNNMSDRELLEAMLEDLPQEEPVLNQKEENSIRKISLNLNKVINKELDISDDGNFHNSDINNNKTNATVNIRKFSENTEEINISTIHSHSCQNKLSLPFLRWAAIFILPLVCVVIWQHLTKGTENFENAVTITTLPGEKANVILPDGSKVSLNYESSLKYSTESFNKEYREVLFEGEGYFDITKDKGLPFVIKTPDIQVRVLGTSFNLLARHFEERGEVLLIEGKVELSSFHSDQVVIMDSNTRALIDFTSGEIALDTISRPEIPWKNGYISFSNKSLKSVIQTLTANYNRQISIDESNIINERFSGYVPSNDIDMALQIIGDIFNLNVEKKDGNYLLSKRDEQPK